MKFDEVSLTGAQRVLVRTLSVVLLDNERPTTLLEDALRSAERKDLPMASDELLRFAEAHLRPRLADEVGSNLSLAFLYDLTAAIGQLDMGSASDSHIEERAHKRAPTQPSGLTVAPVGAPPAEIGRDEIVAKRMPQKLGGSVATLVRSASKTIRAAIRAAKDSVHSHGGRRPSILLVHPDRVVRASFGRALVNGRFDVSVFDSTFEVVAGPSGDEADVAILDISDAAIESLLRSLIAANPEMRVLALTKLETTHAESVLESTGVRRFGVCSYTATPTELVSSVRQLLRD